MFRFTIRDVLWLTVVVSLAVGWWIDHSRAAARHSAVMSRVDRIRTVLNDARSAYWLSANEFFQRRDGGFLPQEPDWAMAARALDELAAKDAANDGGENRTPGD